MSSLSAVRRGAVVALRFLELAEEVDLAALEALADQQGWRLRHQALPVFGRVQDLNRSLDLGERDLTLEDGVQLHLAVELTVYAFGAVALAFRWSIDDEAGLPVGVLAERVRLLVQDEGLTREARSILDGLRPRMLPALDRPFTWHDDEGFVCLLVRETAEPWDPDAVVESADLARLLSCEGPGWQPSRQTREAYARSTFRYGSRDCSVIDWEVGLVLDPETGGEDVLDLIALANTLLLEFRRFDGIVERQVGDLYDVVQRHRRLLWLRPWRMSRVLNRVMGSLLEISEFIDRSDNATKVIEDVYYARVFRGVLERMQVPAWRGAVLRWQQTARQVAEMVQAEAQVAFGHVLEIIIILLIAFEIVMAFVE
jgi:hypothetical protein